MMIVLANATEISIASLFAAGIIPGILIGVVIMESTITSQLNITSNVVMNHFLYVELVKNYIDPRSPF
ncbi:MAG: hypothetical protein CM1200mP13_07350 [Candidatus Pelagibacterales bacterium]|nr:MAG: hypothetical protein CM1200mP13_07350 [Pelagibacterales bacterium]